ncbi:prolipoprotein diacylglyceryl transferase [Bacillus spongiae]|uniref:Phosphatidylglycerol--prolipoprotein diacylglyceryl transferase n=1 Tax=Bacillus spongiae TaxID=2683610 RepID=A0ABU8HEQ9_9BACI
MEPINPIAFKIGSLSVNWYGILIGLGIILALYIAIRESKRLGLDPDLFPDLLMWAIPAAIIGARIYYVIFQWEYYAKYPEKIIQIWNGGLAIHGALIGAVITTILYAKMKKMSFWVIADIAAPSLLIGQAIGRWGNFINQEAHGGPVTRSFLENLYLPDWIINQMYIGGVYYHPTFLYESLWNFGGIILLLFIRRMNPQRGYMFLLYVTWYSIGRFFIEGLRTDSLMVAPGLRAAQVLSIVLIIGAVSVWLYLRKTRKAPVRYQEVSE